MMRRSNLMILGVSSLLGVLAIASGAAGCRADDTTPGGDPGGGEGGTGPATTSTTSGNPGPTSSATTGGGTGGGGTGGEGGAGGASACTAPDATIYQVNQDPAAVGGPIGDGTAVRLKGVIAMSQKFLVTKSSTGRCLWGVFVSAPDVGKETKPYSGVMVVAEGTKAMLDPMDNKTYCPKLGVSGETPGDAIPDDVKPGDELNVVGLTDYFLLSNCAQEPNGSSVAQRQVAEACLVEKTGNSVFPPPPHVFTDPVEIAKLASPTDKAFHDMWGGVKVRVEQVTADKHLEDPDDPMSMLVFVNRFGELHLKDSNLFIGDKLYYRGYIKTDACYSGPIYDKVMGDEFMFDSVEGFGYLNFCTWGLQAHNKCTDLNPPSEDCAAGGPGGMPLMCK
jgi:hypothetical protein